MPLPVGSIRPSAALAAIAASTAEPPPFITSSAIWVASGCEVAAIACGAITSERVAKVWPVMRSAAKDSAGTAASTAAASRERARRRDTVGFRWTGGSPIFAGAAFTRYRTDVMDVDPWAEKSTGFRAKTAPKGVNSGSPKHFQQQPSLCRKRLRWMQRKPIENPSRGLTPPKWLCFSRSHVASQHATANPHRSRRHRRRLAAFDSCARTYYPTNRCGTSQRVSNTHTGTLQKPAPAPVRVFSFQNLVSDATTMTNAHRTTRTCTTTPCGGCACEMRGASSTAFP